MNVVPPQPIPAAAPQPPGAAGAGAPFPLVPGVPGPPSTFAELYNVPTADAHGGVYGPILALFATEPAAGRRTPAEIRAALDAAGDAFLQAYLLLGDDGRTVMIHTVTRYPTLPGQATPWDGARFGFVGDVVGPMAQPVEFPGATAFDLAPAPIRVPTLATMEARWIAAGADPYLPPFAVGDADTELVRTRRSTLLPFVAVPRCLAPMSMRQLWTALGQPLVDGGRQAEMGVLLDWIRVASVSAALQAPPAIQLAAPPHAPLADASLLGFLQCMIQRWLPGLAAPAVAPQVALPAPQVLGILQQFVDDQRTRHQAEDARRVVAARKTPVQRWNAQAMAVLRAATGAVQEADLPPLWHAIANAPKHTVRAEAQAVFDATAQQLGMSTYAPIITVALSRALETLNLCAEAPTVLTEGFQPFNLVPAGFSTQALESAAAAAGYDHLSAGGTTVQYADIQAIQGRQSLVISNSMTGVSVHIRTAYITLATLLGALHPFTLAMRALLEEWVGAEMELPNLLSQIANGPAACVFWMSLRFHYFFHAAQTQPGQGPPIVPRMTKLTEQLRLHIFAQMAPALPARYLPTVPVAPRALRPEPRPDARNNAKNGGAAREGTRVQNPRPNPLFCPYDRAGRLGLAITRHPAPQNAAGEAMCLSFHMRNACNSNCPRATDHRTHTTAEDASILAWARVALAPTA